MSRPDCNAAAADRHAAQNDEVLTDDDYVGDKPDDRAADDEPARQPITWSQGRRPFLITVAAVGEPMPKLMMVMPSHVAHCIGLSRPVMVAPVHCENKRT